MFFLFFHIFIRWTLGCWNFICEVFRLLFFCSFFRSKTPSLCASHIQNMILCNLKNFFLFVIGLTLICNNNQRRQCSRRKSIKWSSIKTIKMHWLTINQFDTRPKKWYIQKTNNSFASFATGQAFYAYLIKTPQIPSGTDPSKSILQSRCQMYLGIWRFFLLIRRVTSRFMYNIHILRLKINVLIRRCEAISKIYDQTKRLTNLKTT